MSSSFIPPALFNRTILQPASSTMLFGACRWTGSNSLCLATILPLAVLFIFLVGVLSYSCYITPARSALEKPQPPTKSPLVPFSMKDMEVSQLNTILSSVGEVPLKTLLPTIGLEYLVEPCAALGVASVRDTLRLNTLALRDIGMGPKEQRLFSRALERRIRLREKMHEAFYEAAGHRKRKNTLGAKKQSQGGGFAAAIMAAVKASKDKEKTTPTTTPAAEPAAAGSKKLPTLARLKLGSSGPRGQPGGGAPSASGGTKFASVIKAAALAARQKEEEEEQQRQAQVQQQAASSGAVQPSLSQEASSGSATSSSAANAPQASAGAPEEEESSSSVFPPSAASASPVAPHQPPNASSSKPADDDPHSLL